MNDFEKITDFSNLYKAYKKAKSGKHYRKSSGRFQVRCLDGINRIKQSLEEHTYKPAQYYEKYVYEPKKRLIKIAPFQDCIVQHSLCDNVLIPHTEKIFIDNNCAGRINKGTSYGLNLLKHHIQEFYDEFGMDGYILKADITKFYYNIDHQILKDLLRLYYDNENVLWLCDVIIDSTDNPGLPLGNQSSQVFASLYLNQLDHLITQEANIKYARYADDFYIIHQSKSYLIEKLSMIEEHLNSIHLTLNGKTQIMPFKQGIKFLGFHTYIENGTVNCKISNDKKRNAYRKYVKMAKNVVAGKTEFEKFNECYTAFKAHAAFGDCEDMLNNLDIRINEIIKNEEQQHETTITN